MEKACSQKCVLEDNTLSKGNSERTAAADSLHLLLLKNKKSLQSSFSTKEVTVQPTMDVFCLR